MIKFETKYGYLDQDFASWQDRVTKAHNALVQKNGKGNDFLGWLDWPLNYDKAEYQRIKDTAEAIRANAEVLVVLGIGGSYLGARAFSEMVLGLYPADREVELLYLGNSFSANYFLQVQNTLKDKSVYLNVISKSGTTTETAMAFRMMKHWMEETYGIQEAKKRIIATTDAARGTLKALADQEGYETFTIPDDIGGRFSVITAVGLLPLAVAGVDIDALFAGLKEGMADFSSPDLDKNPAYRYAVARRILNESGKVAETLVTYEPQLAMFAEWWKQLFGESEGKEGKGLFPTSVVFSTDLHSLGQFIQQGSKVLFETLLLVKTPTLDAIFPDDGQNLDQMNYLAGKSLDYVNKQASTATLHAHYQDGQVPNLILEIEDLSAKSAGYVIYFFFKAIAMSGYLLDLNPFDQPGVEIYKKNMFKLLGKPGY